MKVLILVVVDDGLVPLSSFFTVFTYVVLILVVVDDGLVHCNAKWRAHAYHAVLILVVVDDGLVPL